MHCNWCENASRISDLIGFVGALFLAYPFLTGQSSRDTALLLTDMMIANRDDKKVIDVTKVNIDQDISKKSRQELKLAWMGAGLIALAFISKFVASLFSD
jgi:hypothetical protein